MIGQSVQVEEVLRFGEMRERFRGGSRLDIHIDLPKYGFQRSGQSSRRQPQQGTPGAGY